jgi:starch phosphorylase
MSQLTPRFSANRSVREYTEKYYLPLATVYQARAAENGAPGKQIVDWQHALNQKWSSIQFGKVKVETDGVRHLFEVEVYLNTIDPAAVLVELYAEGIDGGAHIRQKLNPVQQKPEANKPLIYQASVPASRPAADYTPRVIPNFPGVSVPLETTLILWQR